MNITVRIPLQTSQRKKQKIEKAIQRQAEVAESFSQKMPSFSKTQWGGRPSKSMRHTIRNEYPDNNGVKYTHYLYKTAEHISDIYENWRQEGYQGKRPDFTNMDYLILCNCGTNELTFDLENQGVQIPLLKEEEKKDWFKMNIGKYQEELLDKAAKISGNSRIVKKNGRYELHQPVELQTPGTDYSAETKISVHLGLDNIATIAVVKDGELLETKFFDGSQVRHYRQEMNEKRRKMQEEGLQEKIKQIRNTERKYVEQKNHNISKKIVQTASNYSKPVIKLEDLDEIRQQLNERVEYKKHRRFLNSWAFGKLQDFIRYKAEKQGVKVEEGINTEDISIKCYKCGEEMDRPYRDNWSLVYCSDCSEERNADFNAAMNLSD